MYPSMWFMSMVAILVVDVRTGALPQPDAEIRECFQCVPASMHAACTLTPCATSGTRCGTVAVAPAFTSVLACVAAADHPCVVSYSSTHALQLTCTCPGQHCNGPFSYRLTQHLENFTATNTSDLTESFFKSFSNFSKDQLYDMITNKLIIQPSIPKVQTTTHASKHLVDAPRAEALKQEATEPSDDEEDEGEGSGSYEDSRVRRPASAPAAPSSFLPANENAAPTLLVNSLLMAGILFVTL